MKKILIGILALVAIAAAEYPAPAGFKWGSTPSDACRKASTTLEGNLTLCSMTTAPKPIPWVNYYVLVYYKGKLVKVLMDSKITDDDVTGSENVELYDKIKSTLLSKYGDPVSSVEVTGQKLYREYDEFYECLAYTGCGAYSSLWEDPSDKSVVSLEIKSSEFRGRGYVRIIYQAVAFLEYTDDREELEAKATDEGL